MDINTLVIAIDTKNDGNTHQKLSLLMHSHTHKHSHTFPACTTFRQNRQNVFFHFLLFFFPKCPIFLFLSHSSHLLFNFFSPHYHQHIISTFSSFNLLSLSFPAFLPPYLFIHLASLPQCPLLLFIQPIKALLNAYRMNLFSV